MNRSEPPSRAIAHRLRKQITSGDYAPGDKLPSERALAAEHGSARNTAREAIGILQNEGLVDVQHEGHGGITQANVAASIDSWLTANPADVVLLHIGTNDVYQFKRGNPAGTTSAQNTFSILSNANAWTLGANRPSVRLLLARIISQRTDSDAVRDPLTDAFNTDLTARVYPAWTASNTQPKFTATLVDMNSKLNSTTDLTGLPLDETGLHPNATGYTKMANAWFDYLVQTQSITKCP